MYHGEGVAFDPEGLASTLPAITQVIFGYLVGQFIQQKTKEDNSTSAFYELLTKLFVVGSVLFFVGICWGGVFPINKKIWSSSYVLLTTGLATIIISIMIYLIEVRKSKGLVTKLFDVFGKNPLFIYVLSQLLPKTDAIIQVKNGVGEDGTIEYSSPLNWFYSHICDPLFANPNNGSLLFAICIVLFFWCIGFWMDKKKIYVKV
jgi:predicted acyltransferase